MIHRACSPHVFIVNLLKFLFLEFLNILKHHIFPLFFCKLFSKFIWTIFMFFLIIFSTLLKIWPSSFSDIKICVLRLIKLWFYTNLKRCIIFFFAWYREPEGGLREHYFPSLTLLPLKDVLLDLVFITLETFLNHYPPHLSNPLSWTYLLSYWCTSQIKKLLFRIFILEPKNVQIFSIFNRHYPLKNIQ